MFVLQGGECMKNTLLKGHMHSPSLQYEAFIKTKSPRKRALSRLPEGNEIGCSFHMQGGKTMKKLIIAAIATACIALCAAVWARNEVIEKTPTPTPTVALCAAEATSANPGAAEGLMPTEDEITAVPQTEELQENQPASEPEPIEIPTVSETQLVQEQISAPVSTQELSPVQTTEELQPGDLVYVPGFGWVSYEGPNHCEDGTDIYENGNKIGIMG